jgi:hypothetical protein
MVDGTIDGVDVSRDNDAPVNGSTVEGTVWAGADGYRVHGAIKSIDIENPSHVQLHVSETADSPPQNERTCQVTVRMDSVEFVSGQGPGEGALELGIKGDIEGEGSARRYVELPTGSARNLEETIESFEIAEGQSETGTLMTKVTEYDKGVAGDALTGNDDFGQEPTEIVLECGEPTTESVEVPIRSDRGNPGKVQVNYRIGDLTR